MTLTIDNLVQLSAPRLAEHEKPCVICRRANSQRTYRTCGACSERVLIMLGEIGDLYEEQVLDPESGLPVAGAESSTTKSFRSSSPTSLRRIDLTDRRLDIDGERRDVHGILMHWADGVRELNYLPARPQPRCGTATGLAHGTVRTELLFLGQYWWWIRAQPAAARFTRQLELIRNELLELARERAGLVRIGRCTGNSATSCGNLLLVRIGEKAVTCSHCGAHWPALLWSELKNTLT